MTRRPILAFAPLLLAALPACTMPGPQVGTQSSAIVGGTVDTQDPAVAAVLIEDPSHNLLAVCSGTLISPKVVMTAAHCVTYDDPDLTSAHAAAREVFFGANVDGGGQIALVGVVRNTYHPSYDPSAIDSGGDVGLLLLANAPQIKPVPINHSALEGHEGDALRLVGFGITGGGRNDDGTKRQVTTTLDQIDSKLLWVYSQTRNTCNGDSGGPAMVTLNGTEVVAGITSFGDQNCEQEGAYTRVDSYASAFIDPWVAANDPSSAAGCGADGVCTTGCSDPDPDCAQPGGATCSADGMCLPGCDPVDPDCPRTDGVGSDPGTTGTPTTYASEDVTGACAVAPGGHGHPFGAALLLGAAVLLGLRRRRRAA